jgi:hypothetical protein
MLALCLALVASISNAAAQEMATPIAPDEPEFSAAAVVSKVAWDIPTFQTDMGGVFTRTLAIEGTGEVTDSWFTITVPAGTTLVSIDTIGDGTCVITDAVGPEINGTIANDVGDFACAIEAVWSVPGSAITEGSTISLIANTQIDGGTFGAAAAIHFVTPAAGSTMSLAVSPDPLAPDGTPVQIVVVLSVPLFDATAQPVLTVNVPLPAGWTYDSGSSVCSVSPTCSNYSTAAPVLADGNITATLDTTGLSPFAATTLTVTLNVSPPVAAAPGQTWDFTATATVAYEGFNDSVLNGGTRTVRMVSGTAKITLKTASGDDIPDQTEVCLDAICQTVIGDQPSNSVVSFPSIFPDDYVVTVTAPGFRDGTGSVTVTDRATGATTITLDAQAGDAEITLSTVNGGDIPTGAGVCLGDHCELADDIVAAAIASGSKVVFEDVIPGTYVITVQNAAPYVDATGEITITDGETATAEITLQLPAATVTPTTTVTPTVTPTTTTVIPTIDPTRSATSEPTATSRGETGGVIPRAPGATATVDPNATSIATATTGPNAAPGGVSQLPATGSGASGGGWTWSLMLVALGFVVISGFAIITGRVRPRAGPPRTNAGAGHHT